MTTAILNVLENVAAVLERQLSEMGRQLDASSVQGKLLWDMSESWREMTDAQHRVLAEVQTFTPSLHAIRDRFSEMAQSVNNSLDTFRQSFERMAQIDERLTYIAARLDALEG